MFKKKWPLNRAYFLFKLNYAWYVSQDVKASETFFLDEYYEIMGGELTVPQWNAEENLYQDPAFIIPVIISCLALIVIVSAIGICCLKS